MFLVDFSFTSWSHLGQSFRWFLQAPCTFVWEFLLPVLVTPQIVSSFLFHVALLLPLSLFLTLSCLYLDICIHYLFQSSHVYTFTYLSSLRLFIWELLRRAFKFGVNLETQASLWRRLWWTPGISHSHSLFPSPLNPLPPMSDQERISPYNISTISRREVMRIK